MPKRTALNVNITKLYQMPCTAASTLQKSHTLIESSQLLHTHDNSFYTDFCHVSNLLNFAVKFVTALTLYDDK